jgi:hypothetical protein
MREMDYSAARAKFLNLIRNRIRGLDECPKKHELEIEIDYLLAYYMYLECPKIEDALEKFVIKGTKNYLEDLRLIYSILNSMTREEMFDIFKDSLDTVSSYLVMDGKAIGETR